MEEEKRKAWARGIGRGPNGAAGFGRRRRLLELGQLCSRKKEEDEREREEEGDKAHRWDKNALERSERIADGRHMESLALLPVAAWAVVRAQWKNRNLV